MYLKNVAIYRNQYFRLTAATQHRALAVRRMGFEAYLISGKRPGVQGAFNTSS